MPAENTEVLVTQCDSAKVRDTTLFMSLQTLLLSVLAKVE
jgi:hypothetical protein